MPKKFFDILPQKREKDSFEKKMIFLEKKSKPQKKGILFFFIFLFVGGLAFFSLNSFFASCDIELTLREEEKKIEEKFVLDGKISEFQEGEKKLPAKILEKEVQVSEKFLATGEKEKKAQGKILLYNSFATWPETWAKGTRFMSSQGKVFVSKDKILVPPAKIDEKGKIIPSTVEVEVEAQEFGQDYNIGPSKFSVLAFKGTEKYPKYWAESLQPMTGGGKTKVVTKEDLERAKETLKEKAKKEAISLLKKENPQLFVLENLFQIDLLKIEDENLEQKETESFELKGNFRVRAVAFFEKEINSFLEKKFESAFSQNFYLKKETLSLVPTASFDFSKKEGELSVLAKMKAKRKLDLDEIKKNVILFNVEQAREYLEKRPEISFAKITIFPRWKKKIPQNCRITLSD